MHVEHVHRKSSIKTQPDSAGTMLACVEVLTAHVRTNLESTALFVLDAPKVPENTNEAKSSNVPSATKK